MEENIEFKFKLKITDFVGDRLISREAILNSLEDALKQAKRELGQIKIYDHEGRVVHSEHRHHHDDKHCEEGYA